jgi:hypothetical protein
MNSRNIYKNDVDFAVLALQYPAFANRSVYQISLLQDDPVS